MIKFKTINELIESLEEKGLKGRKYLAKMISFCYIFRKETKDNHLLQHSASLTYTTILAIFPLLAVVALFVPVFLGNVKEVESKAIEYIGSVLVPSAGGDMKASITKYFSIFNQNRGAVGVFGIVGIMLSAVALLSSIEKSFNEIWRVYSSRSWARMFSNFTTILVCVPFLIGASIGLSSQLTKIANVLGQGLAISFPYIITCAAFTLAYFILPNTKIRLRHALLSGVLAGLAWEAAKLLFRYYVSGANITLLVKSLGAIPIFLIWIYFSWLITLYGCEFAYVSQNFTMLYREQFRIKTRTVIDSKLIFAVFMIIADSFQKNKGGVSFAEIMKRIPLKTASIKEIIKILISAKFVSETSAANFLPAIPLENIKPADILCLGCKPGEFMDKSENSEREIEKTLVNLESKLLSWESDKTIRDFFNSPKN